MKKTYSFTNDARAKIETARKAITDALGPHLCDAIRECHRAGEPLARLEAIAVAQGANLSTQVAIRNYWNLLTLCERQAAAGR